MSRILAIDYGLRRVGLAVTDPLCIIATPLDTVPTATVLEYIIKYHKENPLQRIVIGEPKQMNGEPSQSWEAIQEFAAKLQETLPLIPIIFEDERFTSKLASAAIAQSGLSKNKKRDKGLIDRTAATIILQSYLENLK
ncbi:MAG: Holliday junction resolvase RuvX [Rikenellaceae bacterium]